MPQLTTAQRYAIEVHHRLKYGVNEIAERTEIPSSTVSRELARNSINGRYDAAKAEKLAKSRRQRGCYKLKGELLDKVCKGLGRKDSPEQISGRLKQQGDGQISHEAIYLMVYRDRKTGGALFENLRRSHRRRRKRHGKRDTRGIIPNKTMIDDRPAAINNKERFGDFEGDTIIGKGHQGAAVTLVDRKSKLVLIAKTPDKSAKSVQDAIIKLLKTSPIPTRSITFDNGTEFANHQEIAQIINAPIFFAHPYHSWERGVNENTNGLIRQFIPKNQNILELDDEFIQTVQDNLNNRPRKLLDFLTPFEFYSSAVAGAAAVAFET